MFRSTVRDCPRTNQRVPILYVPAHVTKVPCHSISGLRHSYNYMCSVTYYLIIGALRLPPSKSTRQVFGTTEKQNETKTQHFHVVNSGFAAANLRMEKSSFSASLRCGGPSPLRGVSSPLRRTLDIAQNLLFLVIFLQI